MQFKFSNCQSPSYRRYSTPLKSTCIKAPLVSGLSMPKAICEKSIYLLYINPFLTSGLDYPYHLDESISSYTLTLFWPVDLTILIIWMSPFLVLGSLVDIYIFTTLSIEISVSKQCRTWSEAAFGGIWTGSALFHNTPKRVTGLKMVTIVIHVHTLFIPLPGVMIISIYQSINRVLIPDMVHAIKTQ